MTRRARYGLLALLACLFCTGSAKADGFRSVNYPIQYEITSTRCDTTFAVAQEFYAYYGLALQTALARSYVAAGAQNSWSVVRWTNFLDPDNPPTGYAAEATAYTSCSSTPAQTTSVPDPPTVPASQAAYRLVVKRTAGTVYVFYYRTRQDASQRAVSAAWFAGLHRGIDDLIAVQHPDGTPIPWGTYFTPAA